MRLESLEEAYATNKKRRRLAYALRRKQSGSGYKGLWDRLSNDLFIIGEVAFDRCTPRKLHGHAPWWTLMLVAVSKLMLVHEPSTPSVCQYNAQCPQAMLG